MDDELRGWKAIADYFGTSDRTVQRWERDLALPVRRRGNAKGSAVVASRLELDEWRSSPAGRQAEGEHLDDAGPPRLPSVSAIAADAHDRGAGSVGVVPAGPRRFLNLVTRRRPAAGASIALGLLLVSAALWYWARTVWRPEAPVSDQRSASQVAIPNSQHAGAAAVAVLKLTAASGEVWSVRVVDGAMATWEIAAGRTLGLSVAIDGDHLRVTLSDIRSTGDGTGPPSSSRVLTLVQGTAAQTAHAGTQMILEWTGTEGRSANAPARSNVVPPRCCVVCGGVTVCATEVAGWCGSCCDPRFTSCRPPL
jgi:hypothetical protein